MKQHNYALKINGTGNIGSGNNSYKSYERSFEVSVEEKEIINGSSDPSFIGDKTKYNPEESLQAFSIINVAGYNNSIICT